MVPRYRGETAFGQNATFSTGLSLTDDGSAKPCLALGPNEKREYTSSAYGGQIACQVSEFD
jgi:hypothetical protein